MINQHIHMNFEFQEAFLSEEYFAMLLLEWLILQTIWISFH
jgi:hypothetical protein